MSTFLHSYLQLRTQTEEIHQQHIQPAVQKCKPEPGTYYFGLLIAERTVIATFKSNPDLLIDA